ncbi:MAG: hypothetical protein AAB547_03600, partial [Patescibacteria group bacterium]
ATGYENVENGALELTLSDEKGGIFHSYRYEGDITSAMMGVKDSFVPKKDYYDFNLTAKIYKDGAVIDETTTRYTCKDLNPNNPEVCPKEKGAATPLSFKDSFVAVGIGVALLIVLALVGFLARRRFVQERDVNDTADNSTDTNIS